MEEKEGNENKEKIKKKCEEDKWKWRKVGGSFPHFWTIRLMIIKKRDRKEKMKEKRREKEREEIVREKRKWKMKNK